MVGEGKWHVFPLDFSFHAILVPHICMVSQNPMYRLRIVVNTVVNTVPLKCQNSPFFTALDHNRTVTV